MVNTPFIYDNVNSCNVCVDEKGIFINKPDLNASMRPLLDEKERSSNFKSYQNLNFKNK
jgi:hypothetical protein